MNMNADLNNRNSDLKNANADLAHRNADLLEQVEQRRNDQSKQELQDRLGVYEAQVCEVAFTVHVHSICWARPSSPGLITITCQFMYS